MQELQNENMPTHTHTYQAVSCAGSENFRQRFPLSQLITAPPAQENFRPCKAYRKFWARAKNSRTETMKVITIMHEPCPGMKL